MPKERLTNAADWFRTMSPAAYTRFKELSANIFKRKTSGGPSAAPLDLPMWDHNELTQLLTAVYGPAGITCDHPEHHYDKNQRALAGAVRFLTRDSRRKDAWEEYIGPALTHLRGHEPRRHRMTPWVGSSPTTEPRTRAADPRLATHLTAAFPPQGRGTAWPCGRIATCQLSAQATTYRHAAAAHGFAPAASRPRLHCATARRHGCQSLAQH